MNRSPLLAFVRRHTKATRLLLVCFGLLALVATVLLGGEELGDKTASIITAFLALLSLGGAFTGFGGQGAGLTELTPRLRHETADRWGREAQQRNLLDLPLIPLPVIEIGGGGTSLGLPDPAVAGSGTTAAAFQRAWADTVLQADGRRLVVTGGAGSGKTTLAVMLALGLAAHPGGPDQRPLTPLLLSLFTWDPARTSFSRWVNDEVARSNPSVLALEPSAKHGRVRELIGSGDVVLILDGFDEIRRGASKDAATQIRKFVPSTAPLIILSHHSRSGALRRIPYMRHLAIQPIGGDQSAAYLEVLSRPGGHVVDDIDDFDNLPGLLADLRDQRAVNVLARSLSTPRSLRHAWASLAEGSASIADLRKIGASGDPAQMSIYLAERQVAVQFAPGSRFPMLRRGRALRWMAFIARQARMADSKSLPWWRLIDTVPGPVLPLLTAASAGPAYLLSLSMPVGLTRGLAIGCVVGLAATMLGGRRLPPLTSVAIFFLVMALVWPIGLWQAGWRQATVDAVEVGLALSLTFDNLPRLFASGGKSRRCDSVAWSRRRSAAATVVAIGAVTAITTSAAGHVIGYDDPDRGPLSLFIGVLFGVGVAVIAARSYVVSGNTTRPSTVRMSWRRRRGGLLAPLLVSIMAATSIGVGGALGGGMRNGFDYGLNVLVFFGVVIGLPVGLTGGFIKWLAAPPRHGERGPAADSSYLRERAVALTAAASVAVVSIGSLLLLEGPLSWMTELLSRESSAFHVAPVNGVLIGLTVGMIVAAAETAWPAFFIAHCWHAFRGRLPWRLHRFVDELHRAEVFRREGEIYRFREDALLVYFAERPRTDRRGRQRVSSAASMVDAPGGGSVGGPPDEGREESRPAA